MPTKRHLKRAKSDKPAAAKREADYRHPEAETPLRPEVGTQAQFRKKKPPVTYRYDSSLSPALDWDGQNPAREQGEVAIRTILDLDTAPIEAATTVEEAKKAGRAAIAQAKVAADSLKRIGKPFLNWAGKAERLSFDVPTLPLFVHERLSTKAIIETLKSHEKNIVAMAALTPDLDTKQTLSGKGVFGGSIQFLVTKNLTAAGPTWALVSFKGPGSLVNLSEVNTDKITLAFTQGPNAGTPMPLFPTQVYPPNRPNPNAYWFLQQLITSSINQQLNVLQGILLPNR